MNLRNRLSALFVFAILGIAGQVQAGVGSPPIVSETFGRLSGTYTVVNPVNTRGSVFGFAIENNLATDTFTTRSSWTSDIVTSAAWDDFPITLEGITLFTLGELGNQQSFDEIFGDDATQAALYWNATTPDNLILAGQSSSEFTWSGLAPASRYIVFDINGNILGLADTPDVAAVPEPFTPALLVLGLAALVVMRRRNMAC